MSVRLCYYGSPNPLSPRLELRAGPLTALYEAGDLRYVRIGDHEICRRWYAAVRDHNWDTVPGIISDEVINGSEDGFQARYTSTHRRGDIHFVWTAIITGDAEGTITFTFDGQAKSTFQRNRIGFCVLHPARESAGARCRLSNGDGTTKDAEFPEFIAPWNPFRDLTALSHEVAPGMWAEWRFAGDWFETEDQRNWIDASFKTFCTPLSRPFPVELEAGAPVRQTVTLRFSRSGSRATNEQAAAPTLALRPEMKGPTLPTIGLGMATHGQPLSPSEIERLRLLRPAHLRAEIDFWKGGVADAFSAAAQQASEIGCGLELAVTVTDAYKAEAHEFGALLARNRVPITRVLLFHHRHWSTPAEVVAPVTAALAAFGLKAPVFVGTTANFAELNRDRPPVDWPEGACYSVQPQEHAFDNSSIVESCAAIADTVRSARRFCGDRPLAVTPITLRKRVNPYATGPAPPVPPGEPPPNVDPRQMSLFGAGWTLAALKYLAESGATSTTFYETTGWLGVIEQDGGCPLPEQFPSRPGMAFPLFHVLADATEFAGGQAVPVVSSAPLSFDGLTVRRGGTTRVMLANLTEMKQVVTLTGLHQAQAAVRMLDETTFERATAGPFAFRAEAGEPVLIRDGKLTVELHPYAYVRIDCD